MNEYDYYAASGSANPMGGLVFLLVMLALYAYMAYALMTIAKKTNTQNAWLAWVPIANMFLILMIAKKPLWWFILFLIPLLNIVFIVLVWMAVAEALGKPSWLGILMLIPAVNIVVLGYLAFSQSSPSPMPTQMPPPPSSQI